MILVIDNYDSFTFNLVQYLQQLGAEVRVERNDALSTAAALALEPQAIVLSPGPCTPSEAGICLDLVRAAAAERLPLLGVCLGHQAIGQAFGGQVIRAPKLMHGKTDDVFHHGTSVFRGLPSPFRATRYHSLIVDAAHIPAELEVTATASDGVVMGLAHRDYPVHGVQFHPESIATEHGHALLANFLDIAGVPHRSPQGLAA